MVELEVVSENINAFNESNVLLRETRKRLFENTIFRKEKWGHVFQEPARETINEKNEKKLEWFYEGVELSFSISKITKDNKICGWVSSKSFVDVFELKINPDNEIISATVNTVK